MAVPAATPSRLTPRQLLRLSQSVGPDAKAAQDRIVAVFGKKLDQLASQTCRRYYLQNQEREEVVAETYQLLLNPDIVRFAPRRGKPEHYFKGLVQNAARKVMAQLGERRRKGMPASDAGTACRLGLQTEANAPPGVKGYRFIPTPRSPAEEAEIRDTVRFILGQAPLRVRKALELCYWEEWSFQGVAAHLGVSRFSLARKVRAFFDSIRSQFGDG
jgi:DNA-directed RNA polymerase specialized sigma24 family protein